MELILENWRKFLTEEQGQYIGTIDDVGSNLYRLSKRYGAKGDNLERFKNGSKSIRSRDKSEDRDDYYRNSDGEIEHRIYFFSSQDEAFGHLMSDFGEIEAVLGDFEKGDVQGDLNQSLLFITIEEEQFPLEVEFFSDPEFRDSSAIYGAYPDGRAWELKPKPKNVLTAEEIANQEEEDDYYYEDFI